MTKYLNESLGIWIFSFTISFICLSFFATTISPFTLDEGCDSCVFKQMGLTILSGKIPYLSLFDHKGPILYFINAIGLGIGGRFGLFMLSVINLTIVLRLWYAIAKHYVSGALSFLPVLITLLFYLRVMEGGNLTEDWCLLPLSYSLYLASRMLVHKVSPSFVDSLFLGMSAGIILFIRVNNSALLVCAFILIGYLSISYRTYKNLFNNMMGMILGFAFVVISVLLFFFFNYGQVGVTEMLYGTFFFNFEYYQYHNMGFLKFFLANSGIFNVFFLFPILLCFNLYKKRNTGDRIAFMFFLLSFVFCYVTMGKATLIHYLVVVVPLIVMSISYAFKDQKRNYVLCILLTLLLFSPYYYRVFKLNFGFSNRKELCDLFQKTDSAIDSMDENEKNQIWNYNTYFTGIQILQHKKLTQCNRVVLDFQLKVSDKLKRSEKDKLISLKPRYIILDSTRPHIDKEDSLFIVQNYYIKDNISNRIIMYAIRD